jgi:ElaB/YqjD/DUF883 family membrane-anchored ribosome-binding protein
MAHSISVSNFEDVREAVKDIAKTCMEKLAVILEDCGYDYTSIQQRCEAIKKHVQSLFDAMLEEKQENKNEIIGKTEQYLEEEMSELRKALCMEIPVSDNVNLPLCDVEHIVHHKPYMDLTGMVPRHLQ